MQFLNGLDDFSLTETHICEPELCASLVENPSMYLKIFQQNIRSLNKNFSALCVLLARIKLNCDIIMLSECWLKHVHNLPTLEGFSSFATSNNYNQNDGVVLMIKTNLVFQVEEINVQEANCLLVKLSAETVIVAIYRPPCFLNTEIFIESLQNLITELSGFKNILIIGDININSLADNNISGSYLDVLSFHGLMPAYFVPTRIDACLDHVILKTKLSSIACIMKTPITDHDAILFCLKTKKLPVKNTNIISGKINYDQLLEGCKEIDLTEFYSNLDINHMTNFLISELQNLIYKHTLKIKISRNKITIKPWITVGLLKCIRNRDRMHAKLKKDPNNVILTTTYKRYRNFCNNILKKCKRQYEKDQLNASRNNNKNLWYTIKSITNLNNSKQNSEELLYLKSTKEDSVDEVNNFFATIGAKLASKIPATAQSDICISANPTSSRDSFALMMASQEEVENIILNLKTCAEGGDGISSITLKKLKDFLVPPLTHLFNRCLEEGVFPTALKKSIVIPIHKCGKRDCITNYRPISLLPSLSKILEKIINKRLINYLENKNLLSESQFGFRTGRSTDDAVHIFTDFVIRQLDNKKKCLTIFLDLAKAFDTVSFPILLQKLETLGIRGNQLRLFRNYISDRTQSVKVGGVFSKENMINFGVPQGSIIGPTLFLCYINELTNLKIANCKILSYADDTTLTFYGDSWEEVYNYAQSGFNVVCSWLAANSLTLNASKTKFLPFYLKHPSSFPSFDILAHSCDKRGINNCNCPKIEKTDCIKYLGVFIDSNLNFSEHIKITTQKIRKLTYVFKQLRHVADKKLIKTVYLALCQSVLSYCILSWGGSAKTRLLSLERAQRLILKVSYFKPRLFPTVQLYKECEVLTVRKLFILHVILKQHTITEFSVDHPMAGNRRHYTVCLTNYCKTSLAQNFFLFLGGRLYNKANQLFNIYPLTKKECKQIVTKWLLALDYEEVEHLLSFI